MASRKLTSVGLVELSCAKEERMAPNALSVLRDRFGHDSFIGMQEDIVECLLRREDALVIMPTRGGKSLCFQLPALILPGLTVVISPLIALMKDQVDALQQKGLPATFINSSLEKKEREGRLSDVVAGKYKLLYVTPERFRKSAFVSALAAIDVSLLAVDEAHCITTWGHDFRPEYGRVGKIRESLGNPVTVALTATAAPDTQREILRSLGIEGARTFHSGIERPNLHISVHQVFDHEERLERIIEVIEKVGGPGIVYMSLIRDIRALEDELLRRGMKPLVYHGDLSAHERRQMQDHFFASQDEIVLATNAFGMGVDKADIRIIIHGQIPGSPEAYYQEIGRAGRDGEPSLCELIYFPEDILIRKQFIEWANPTHDFMRSVFDLMVSWGENLYAHDVEDIASTLLLKNRRDGRAGMVIGLLRAEGIIEGQFERGDLRIVRDLEPHEEESLIDSAKRERDLTRLLDLVRFAQEKKCRRRLLYSYFGFHDQPDCGNCDRCMDTDTWIKEQGNRQGESDQVEIGADSRRTPEPDNAPVKRGEWLLINRRHHVVVKKVEHGDAGTFIEAESARDLEIRRYDLSRIPWQRLE